MASKDLPELRPTVVRVRDRIAGYRAEGKSINEANTKKNLIEPVLAALGWDLHGDDVQLEYKHRPKSDPVDYALFGESGRPVLYVEAKSLGQNLADEKWASQVLKYAFESVVEWCVLTNGDEYRVFNSKEQVPFEEKLFRSISLTDLKSEACVLETLGLLTRSQLTASLLNRLWEAQHVDRQVSQQLRRLVDECPTPFVNLIRIGTKGLSRQAVAASLKSRVKVQIDVPWSPIAPPPPPPGDVDLRALINAGLISPPLHIEVDYKGHSLSAEIRPDATVVFEGEAFASLSAAGGVAKAKIVGVRPGQKPPATNGWDFWRFHDVKTQTLQAVDVLRQRYLKRTGDQTIDSDAAAFATKGLRIVKPGKKSELSKA